MPLSSRKPFNLEWYNIKAGWEDFVLIPEHIANGRVSGKERILIVGSNGCGKSTFLKALIGAAPIRQGKISVLGNEFGSNYSPSIALANGIVYVPETGGYFESLTVDENVSIIDGYGGNSCQSGPFSEWVLENKKYRLKKPSGGERQKIVLERAWRAGASCMLLDEPWNGLDEKSSIALSNAVDTFPGALIVVQHEKKLSKDDRKKWSLLTF